MKQLLAAIDFSGITGSVLEQAAALAGLLDSKLWVLHVASDETQAMLYESTPFTGYSSDIVHSTGDVQLARNLSADELRHEHKQLLGISAKLRTQGVDAQAILLKGDAARMILDKAADLQADMIILGSHGHGLLRKALLGSVTEAVIRQARSNVLIVPMPADQTNG